MSDGVVEGKLAELGLELPTKMPEPAGNYVGAVSVGNLVFVSGHGPYRDGELQYIGRSRARSRSRTLYRPRSWSCSTALPT